VLKSYEFGPNGDSVEAMWNLFIALTTANHPDVFMPLYHARPWAIIFTFSYMVVTNLIFMNLLLAVITSEFSQIMEQQHLESFKMRLAMLEMAFNGLADRHSGGEKTISFDTMLVVLNRVSEFDESSSKREITESEMEQKIEVGGERYRFDCDWRLPLLTLLDSDGGGDIGISEFKNLDSMWHMPIRLRSLTSDEAHFRRHLIAKGRGNWTPEDDEDYDPRHPDQAVRRFAANFPTLHFYIEEYAVLGSKVPLFQWVTGTLLVASIALALVNFETATTTEKAVFLFFAVAFLIEIIVRFLAESSRFKCYRYLTSPLNWADIVGNLMMWLWFTSEYLDIITEDTQYIFTSLFGMARGLRVIRFAKDIPALALLIRSVGRVVPVVTPYFGLFIMQYYVFAVIGMAIFAGDTTQTVDKGGPGNWTTCGAGRGVGNDGKTSSSNQCWNKSLYGQAEYYYELNFDHTPSAFFTLFVLMVQNNWHVTTDGFVQARDRSVRWFFILYWVLVTVIMINVFVGVLIEMLDLYRRDELAKEAGAARALMEYQDRVKIVLQEREAASGNGNKWSDVWEIYEKPSTGEQLMIDYRLSQSQVEVIHNAKAIVDDNIHTGDLYQDTWHVPSTVCMQNLRTPVFGRSVDGDIVYCNLAFANIFDRDRVDHVVGDHEAGLLGEEGIATCNRMLEPGGPEADNWVCRRHGRMNGSKWTFHLQNRNVDIPCYQRMQSSAGKLRKNKGCSLFMLTAGHLQSSSLYDTAMSPIKLMPKGLPSIVSCGR